MIKRIIIILFFLFVLTQVNCLAQNKMDSINVVFVTVTPTALLNYYPGIQAGVEIGINKFGYVELEGTYLIKSALYRSISIQKGYRVGLNYKYPLTKANNIKMILAFQYRNSDQLITNEFDRGFGSFFQEIAYEQNREMVSAAIGFAYSLKIKKIGELEIAARTGLGRIDIINEDLPDDAELIEDFFIINGRYFDGGRFTTPVLGMSVKLKFGL